MSYLDLQAGVFMKASATFLRSLLQYRIEHLNRLLEITQGNLWQDNLVLKMADQLGTVTHAVDNDPRNDKVFYLRNAFNNFVDGPFDALDFSPGDDITTLGSEAHSSSRLFTGAFYDVLEADLVDWANMVPCHMLAI